MAFLMRSLAASSLGMTFLGIFSLSVADDVSADTCARGSPRPSAPAAPAPRQAMKEKGGRGTACCSPRVRDVPRPGGGPFPRRCRPPSDLREPVDPPAPPFRPAPAPRRRRRHVKQAVDDGREIAWGSSSQSPTTPPPVGGPRPAAGRAARPVRASVRAALPAPAGPGAVSPARPPTARPRGTHRGASPGPVVLGRPLDLHLRGLLGRVHRRRRAPSAAARAGGGAEERGRAPPSARRPGARGPSERGASALGMQDQPAPQPPPPRRAPGPDRGGEGRGGRGRAGGPGAGGSPGVAHRGNLSAGRRGPGAGAAGG